MTAQIAWIDVESTGTDVRKGQKLLQIAVIVTDADYNELGEIESKFYFSPDDVKNIYAETDPFVQNMHTQTGLWDALSDETNPSHADFDEKLLAWLKELAPEAGVLYFGGNSIFLDREFMREYLPKSYEHLSYRSIDMTAIEIFLVAADGRPRYKKQLVHEAMDDIRESLDQARYHRELAKPPF
jgi:oligoribonuclease